MVLFSSLVFPNQLVSHPPTPCSSSCAALLELCLRSPTLLLWSCAGGYWMPLPDLIPARPPARGAGFEGNQVDVSSPRAKPTSKKDDEHPSCLLFHPSCSFFTVSNSSQASSSQAPLSPSFAHLWSQPEACEDHGHCSSPASCSIFI